MVIVAVVGAILVAAVAAMVLVGRRLPGAHSAACAAHFSQPPETVWATLSDVEGAPRWRKDLKRVERLPDQDGKPAWVEDGKFGRIPFTLEEERPPALRVTRIADPKLPFGGTWTYQLVPENGGTRLTITEDGQIRPALFRFLSRYLFGYHATLENVLKALGRHFGEDPSVSRVPPATDRGPS